MIIQKQSEAADNVQQQGFQPPPPSYAEINADPGAPPPAHTAPSPSAYPPSPYGETTTRPQPSAPSHLHPHPQPPPSNLPPQQTTRAELGRQYQQQLLARCAAGQHEPTTTFGICGIVCAILLFPIGLIFLCIDTESKCSRCGVRL